MWIPLDAIKLNPLWDRASDDIKKKFIDASKSTTTPIQKESVRQSWHTIKRNKKMENTITPVDKTCVTCKHTKLLHEFDQDKRSKDLRKNECRDCIKNKNKTRGNKEDKEGYPLRFQCIECKRFDTAVPFDDNEIQRLANYLYEREEVEIGQRCSSSPEFHK